MADEDWYVLKVRSGFESVVAYKLRKLKLQVIVPDQSSIDFREPSRRNYPWSRYVYCRFPIKSRLTIMNIPGVLDIVGTLEPAPNNGT